LSSLVVPAAVVALANKRLRDLNEAMSRKLNATLVNPVRGNSALLAHSRFGATERRVLGMVRQTADQMGGRDQVAVNRDSSLDGGPSKFTVLGAAGFELPAYADAFSPAGSWRSDALRRGTPDPNLSRVVVPTTQFAIRVGEKAILDAGANQETASRARAFSLGMLSAVAAGVVSGPVQRGMHNRATPRDWTRYDSPAELAAVEADTMRILAGRRSPGGRYHSWWPSAQEVPDALFTGYLKALDEVYGLDRARPQGWPSFEENFVAGDPLELARLKSGYARLRTDQGASAWTAFHWFCVLSPMLAAPSLSLALTRLLPHGRRFFDSGSLTERSFTEIFTLTEAISSISPFAYSMFLRGQVPERREAFNNAIALFVARLALTLIWLPTIGSEANDPAPALRWVLSAGLLGTDVYALIRGLRALGDSHRGNALLYFMQTLPGASALATTGVAALLKAARLDTEKRSWIAWGVITAGLLLGAGIPISMALAGGGGYLSWFLTDRRLGAIASRGSLGPGRPSAPALAFDDSTLWSDPAVSAQATRPNLADMNYPSGTRPLLKVWWEGAGDLYIAHDAETIRLRHGPAGAIAEVVLPPGQRTAGDLVTALMAALPGVHALVVDPMPPYDLPRPSMLADPGDEEPDQSRHESHKSDFIKLGTSAATAHPLRHSPRAELATAQSLRGPALSAFEDIGFVPDPALGDLEDTALGAAADLAVLLCIGALPTLITVNPVNPEAALGAPAVPGPIGPVYQVFRQWNLDERRVNEWKMLVSGGGVSEKAPGHAADRDPVMRPDPAGVAYASRAPDGEALATAMGWLPVWRAWVRVASDTTADAEANMVMAYTPSVRGKDGQTTRPSNRELTAAVRFLLDLP
jgi:hypothetical protein